MPNWKKVLLSGSKASVFDITASNLPSEDSSLNDVIVINSKGHFQTASRGDFGGAAKGPDRAVQFAYTEDGGSSFILSGSEFLLFDEVERELIISASGEGSINIGRDGGISNGDTLGNLNFIGTGSVTIEGPSATIQAVAVQDFDANTKGAKLEFYTADDQDTDLGIPKLVISGSIVSSSVDLLGKSLITDGDISFKEGNNFLNIISVGGTGYSTTFGYGASSRLDIQGGTEGIKFLSPITSSFPISSSNTITANNITVSNDVTVANSLTVSNNATIDDIEIIGDKIEDANNPNCFVEFNGDLTLASPTDVRIIIDSNDNEGSSIFEVMNDGADEGNASSLFSINQSGNVTVAGTVDGRDIAADGTKLDTAATFTASLDADLTTFSVPASTTISDFGKTLVDDANNSAARTTLGVRIGSDVQAYSSILDTVANGTYVGDDSITTLGTISTGIWQGTAIADAYLSSNTAHLSETQTFTGTKTFNDLRVSQYIRHSGDTNTNISFDTDQIDFYAGGLRMLTLDENPTSQDTVVINENSADIDFRVEGNNDTHALFVQGSNDHVGIGTSTPVTKLHVVDSITNTDDSFVARFENVASDDPQAGGISIKIDMNTSQLYPFGAADSGVGNSSANGNRFIEFSNSNGVNGYIRAGGIDGMNTSIVNTSDRRYKTNIEDLDTGLDAILKTRPVSFNWKDNPDSPKIKGFIAQEIKEILPETVDYDAKEDKYYMSDTVLIPTLVKAIQDQQKIIDSLEARLNKLEQL